MKKIRYNKIFGWLAAAVLLLTTSCKDDMLFGNGQSEEVTVTFTLTPEAVAPLATRAHKGNNVDSAHVIYPDDNEFHHISDGSRADMLIYSLYEKVDNGKGGYKYELLEGYSDGSDITGIDAGDGQTIMSIDEFPVTIRLTLKRGAEYAIAFWAQNSKCKAYNTKDLRKVEVIYGELDDSVNEDNSSNGGSNGGNGNSSSAATRANTQTANGSTTTPNNDERRDAFCRSLTFTAGEGGLEQNVLLYRPLAQINVGTSGYDFETITRNAGKKYLYSKIRLNRVARYLDVVEDKTYSSTTDEEDPFSQDDTKKTAEAFAVVDFGYAPIPAYVNWPEKGDGQRLTPQYPSYTTWDWEYNENYQDTFIHNKDGITEEDYTGEEFLKVHLYDDTELGIITNADDGKGRDKDGKIYTPKDADGYRKYANLTNHNEELSETFKYLSMCYVLTSSTKDDAITINNVKVWVATDAEGNDEMEIINLNNVPAQRNWRTNIVGNILTEENTFTVKLDRDFAGEYNGIYNGSEAEWSGPLAKGVYYDAEKDEIQISDVDGLIWLQKMVNGDLRVREKKSGNNIVKTNYTDKYPYYVYTATGKTTLHLDYDGISEPDDKTLRDRILKATHQDHNENMNGKSWPEHKNFHFCGSNGPANIKLMADLNLAGIKWIPIGYDFKIYDTSVGKTKNDIDNSYNFDESDGTQRAFCGRFDGNNHTISNLYSRRFSAWVHETAEQVSSSGPYDNVQWMPAGLFGLVGGCGTTPNDNEKKIKDKQYTEITNLRLFNVDVFGYHTAAAVAAIVNSVDDKIDITNCIVDGGSIELSPMYRGDTHNTNTTIVQDGKTINSARTRTFARGIYLGGIVGQYVADGVITGCEVRNITIHGYRQIGGLVGSVSNQEQNLDETFKNAKMSYTPSQKFKNLKIEGNKIDKLLIIADKFQPYDSIFNIVADGVWKNGFGWKESQKSLANPFVGGTATEVYTNNSAGNIQFTEFSTGAAKGTTSRKATVGNVPLKHIPMLSSWFCDEINLNGNYYGETSGHINRTYHDFQAYSWRPASETYSVPFNLPYELKLDYNEKSANAAMYVESVTLDGSGGIGGRSVITPERVMDDDACVMYVAARDRKQFSDILFERAKTTSDNNTRPATPAQDAYRKPTIIKNVVLRGSPYAGVGMLFAPNKNMTKVELHNVAIYDVYKTLALHSGDGGANWTDAGDITLNADKCNFRGYTVPGKGWNGINYTNTTFEEGTYTGHGRNERTYKAEATTTFTNCIFKAPYRIDLSSMPEGTAVTFTESKASSASPTNKLISINDDKKATKLITITSDSKGNPVIRYYANINKDGKGTDLIVEE
ncbi:MAG: hypothetical protein J1F40_07695 [Prevotellaceae bacterium]|nr:hypothetical protein [Prevotellaceae bacterium]